VHVHGGIRRSVRRHSRTRRRAQLRGHDLRDTKLTADVDGCAGDGIVIGADEITLDLNGHTVPGTGNDDGIDFDGHNGVRVEGGGGKVKMFNIGLNLEDANGNTITELSVTDNNNNGVLIQDTAFGNTLKEVTVSNTHGTGVGIFIGDHSNGTRLKHVTANGNDNDGIALDNTGDTSVKANHANHNDSDGIHVSGGGVVLTDNSADNNGDNGIDASGATDGGGNSAKGNGSTNCVGVSC
jgi:parallel beta-helix repeat protein